MNTITKTSLLLAAGMMFSLRAGDITGRVTLKGTAPPERTVDLKSDAALAAKHPMGLSTRHYQVIADAGLQQVLVYISGDLGGKTFEAARTSPVLDHVDGLFQPYVIGLQVGQQVRLKCSDRTICSFTTFSKANSGFAIAPFHHVVPRTFTEPEVPVRLKCDLHPWNSAYIGVFAHPYFTVTDEQGRFTVRDVPAGRYTLEIFHPKSGRSSKAIVISQEASKVDFEVSAK